MSDEETLCALAHELAHCANGDPCGEDEVIEKKAWRKAADWLIRPHRYAQAEQLYGPHPQLIAAELGVTRHLVDVWREWKARAAPMLCMNN